MRTAACQRCQGNCRSRRVGDVLVDSRRHGIALRDASQRQDLSTRLCPESAASPYGPAVTVAIAGAFYDKAGGSAESAS